MSRRDTAEVKAALNRRRERTFPLVDEWLTASIERDRWGITAVRCNVPTAFLRYTTDDDTEVFRLALERTLKLEGKKLWEASERRSIEAAQRRIAERRLADSA